jgi:voltage-gated potassium channel
LNPKLTIVSKAIEERTIRKLLKAGANRVISPNQIAGKRLASIILRPSVVDFLEVMVDGGKMPMRIEEVAVNTGSPLIGKNLRETGVGQHTGAIIVGIMGSNGRAKINPTSTSTLAAINLNIGDTLIAMGSEEQIKRLQDFVKRG